MTKQHQMAIFCALAFALTDAEQPNFAPDDFDQIGAARTDFNMKTTCGVCEDFEPPTLTSGLNTGNAVQNGGIPYLAILDANYPLADELILANWNSAIAAKHMWVFRECLDGGEMTNDQTVEELGSCQVSVVTKNEQTIVFNTFLDNATYDRFKFLKALGTAQSCFLLAFGDCNGNVFGFVPVTIQAPAYNIGATKTDRKVWTITAKFDAAALNPPLAVAWNFSDFVTT